MKQKYCLAVDIGGTNIKAGLFDQHLTLLRSSEIPTQEHGETGVQIVGNMIAQLRRLLAESGLECGDIDAIGIGCPGTVVNSSGRIVFAGNLPFRSFPLRQTVRSQLTIPVILANDANVAALAESRMGAGRGKANTLMITLGTGVGGGVIMNHRIYTGFNETGCELGHMVIRVGGETCTCGRRGCLEAYVSATALIRQTRRMIADYPDSELARIAAREGCVSGKTAFHARRKGDPIGTQVVETYCAYLTEGLANLLNCFMPEILIIGGGISNEGQALLDLIEAKTLAKTFVFKGIASPRICLAQLGSEAGLIGAAILASEGNQRNDSSSR